MPISRSEIRPLERHVQPDSPPPILRFEIVSVITQDLLWSAKKLKAVAGGGLALTGLQFNLHRSAGSVTLNIGDRGWMIWKRDSRRWEVLTSAAGTGVSVVRFELNDAHAQDDTTPVDATVVQWNGAAYVPTGADIWVVDSIGEWGKAAASFQGWGVQIGDRTIYDPGADERAVYEIIFLESYARWGEATLDFDMGDPTPNEAGATISGAHRQWGAAPNHRDHTPATITIKDRFRVGACLKAGDQVLWLWDEEADEYYLMAPQGEKVAVRAKDPCDYLEDQMENETPWGAGPSQKPVQTSDTTVFTDVFNYSLEQTLADDFKIRDYVDWTVVNEYSAGMDQALVHLGSANVADVRVESTTNRIVVDEVEAYLIKPGLLTQRVIHQGTECP
jgi:hypothetical protein